MKTSLAFLSAYSHADMNILRNNVTIEIYDDDVLAEAIEDFFNDLKSGKYGLEPYLPLPDARQRLKNLASFLNVGQQYDVNSILNKYVSYIRARASNSQLINEISMSLGKFYDTGYNDDAKICEVSMLNKLSPEFMEALRAFGGVYFGGSVPRKIAFRRLLLGPHSTCLALMGLWATYVYSDGTVEYYVFPDREAIMYKVSSDFLEKLKDKFANIIRSVKNRPITNAAALSLITALTTAGAPSLVRKYIVVTFMRGGYRVELIEHLGSLSSDPISIFADRLSDDLRKKLLSLAIKALSKATGDPVTNAAIKIIHTIFLALNGVISPFDAINIIARRSYAQETLEVAKKIGLTSRDSYEILDALEGTLREIKIRY